MPPTSPDSHTHRRLPWKQRIDDLASRSPLQTLFSRRAANHLAVLAYHGVDDESRFGDHLSELRRATNPVSLGDVIAAVRSGEPLPPRSTLVTFDDGRVSIRDRAVPMLVEKSIPAVAFVNPGLLDTDEPYWWEEVRALVAAGARLDGMESEGLALVEQLKVVPDRERRRLVDALRGQHKGPRVVGTQLRTGDLLEMEAAGVDIGNHTMTHPCLDQCDDAEVDLQVRGAHEKLASVLGHPPLAFAFPNGNFDQRAVDAVQACGYEVAFAWDHRLSPRLVDQPLLISRLRVNAGTPLSSFRTILSGMHPAFLRVAQRAKRRPLSFRG